MFRESPQKELEPFATVLGAETVSGVAAASLWAWEMVEARWALAIPTVLRSV